MKLFFFIIEIKVSVDDYKNDLRPVEMPWEWFEADERDVQQNSDFSLIASYTYSDIGCVVMGD